MIFGVAMRYLLHERVSQRYPTIQPHRLLHMLKSLAISLPDRPSKQLSVVNDHRLVQNRKRLFMHRSTSSIETCRGLVRTVRNERSCDLAIHIVWKTRWIILSKTRGILRDDRIRSKSFSITEQDRRTESDISAISGIISSSRTSSTDTFSDLTSFCTSPTAVFSIAVAVVADRGSRVVAELRTPARREVSDGLGCRTICRWN